MDVVGGYLRMKRMHKSSEIDTCVLIGTCQEEGKSYDVVMPKKGCSVMAEAKENL